MHVSARAILVYSIMASIRLSCSYQIPDSGVCVSWSKEAWWASYTGNCYCQNYLAHVPQCVPYSYTSGGGSSPDYDNEASAQAWCNNYTPVFHDSSGCDFVHCQKEKVCSGSCSVFHSERQCLKYEYQYEHYGATVTYPDSVENNKTYTISGASSFTVNSGASKSGNNFTVNSSARTVVITVYYSGKCSDQRQISIPVRNPQTISLETVRDLIVGKSYEIKLTSSSGLSNFQISSEDVHFQYLDGSVISDRIGIYMLTVTEPGNDVYASVTTTFSFIVSIDNLNPNLFEVQTSDGGVLIIDVEGTIENLNKVLTFIVWLALAKRVSHAYYMEN